MTVASEFENSNQAYVKAFTKGDLALPPARKVAVIVCMDARIDPAASLGLQEGDAHVIRNAGGRASDALRSVIISQKLLGTREIVIVHHTDCGMLTFTDKDIRDIIKKEGEDSSNPANYAAAADTIAFLPFSNLKQSVIDDIEFLKSSPLVLDVPISGYIYDVKTGRIEKVN
ncbi:putative carbonic anhydrase [[Candida] railenensis]|uniref:Carbonic anhydrase n=1 Tax=[Candida] railenensis TaxID=45579 RepID=A0A9P0W1L4_9ASCO|nr:putative carbonic anhydrase [[Candida] railenensis]